ncbi:MAG: hypothetical protein LBG78_04200 [Azoarcus sp.]|jgi:hypothetical protein|nr:hypothetical protein [Azoarcus sp.]
MYRDSESVFRLSLAGIAFFFFFVLLTVFGHKFSNSDEPLQEPVSAIVPYPEHSQAPAEAIVSPDSAPLSENSAPHDQAAHERLFANEKKWKREIQALNTQLEGLTETRRILEQSAKPHSLEGTTTESMLSALELRARAERKLRARQSSPGTPAPPLDEHEIVNQTLSAIELQQKIENLLTKELGQRLPPDPELTWTQWLVDYILLPRATEYRGSDPRKSVGEENNILRAQMVFLRSRLETHNDSFLPPCWFDAQGQQQFLLRIDVSPVGNISVTAIWPSSRETEAQTIPGLKKLLSIKNQPYDVFVENAAPVIQHSGNQCHYSIQVMDNLKSGKRSEQMHQKLEALFNLVDMPRNRG